MRIFLFLFTVMSAFFLHAQTNTALEAHPRLELDQYDWYARHARIVKKVKTFHPQVVLLGDSITHFWGSETDGAACRGKESWKKLFGKLRVLNAGFGWDRIQNVRWRIRNGELEGVNPQLIILHIGTNNWSETSNARQNTPQETAEAIYDLTGELLQRFPDAKLIVFDIFPRSGPNSAVRKWINTTNHHLSQYTWDKRVCRLSAQTLLTLPDGTLIPGAFTDGVHPSAKGYNLLAEFLMPYLNPIKFEP